MTAIVVERAGDGWRARAETGEAGMAIIIEPDAQSWRRFRGSPGLDPLRVARLVEDGVWSPADLAPHGLRVAVPFQPAHGQTAVGPERFEEMDGEVFQMFDTVPAPEPEPRRIGKSVILSRITDAQLAAALAILTPMQMERWRSPDAPTVQVTDPEVIGMIVACGADPAVVLAPEDQP